MAPLVEIQNSLTSETLSYTKPGLGMYCLPKAEFEARFSIPLGQGAGDTIHLHAISLRFEIRNNKSLK